MKSAVIGAIVVAVVAGVVGVSGAAGAATAPSMGSVSLPGKPTPANLMTGTWFSVNTPPITSSPTDSNLNWQNTLSMGEGMFYEPHCIDNNFPPYDCQSQNEQWIPPMASCTWDTNYSDYNCTPGPLEIYTVACWGLSVDVIGPSQHSYWKCGVYHSNQFGPSASENEVAAQFAVGSLGTAGYQQCSWLGPYDPSEGVCSSPTDGSAYGPGNASPTESGNLMPDLDPYVGKTINFFVGENWCSFIAPPNYDVVTNDGWDSSLTTPSATANTTLWAPTIGCYGNSNTIPISLASTNAARMLASTSTNPAPPVIEKVTLSVQAGATDCHVPYVKGLKLRKAKARLHKANCGASVRYVKGAHAGRVRYQPLRVGLGKPRGFPVKLAVVR
ncbi:MAG TPA: hypothetical protein VFU30_03985 [Gaiellaceae bacterium]|nr:hypothetical protein [Gaiellaceae bacterium]